MRNVGTWMKKDVVSIRPEASLLEAAQLRSKKRIGTLPVVDGRGRLVGLTSLRAIVRLFMPDFVQLVGDVDFVWWPACSTRSHFVLCELASSAPIAFYHFQVMGNNLLSVNL